METTPLRVNVWNRGRSNAKTRLPEKCSQRRHRGARRWRGPLAQRRGPAGAQNAVERLNLLLIVADQRRAGLTKRSGYPPDTSPTLDALAALGVAFNRAYCTAPLCVPGRVSTLTGRWPNATRVRSNRLAGSTVYEKHLFQVAQECGYRTGLAGKNRTFLRRAEPRSASG